MKVYTSSQTCGWCMMCPDNPKATNTNDAKERIYPLGHDVANLQAHVVPFDSLRNILPKGHRLRDGVRRDEGRVGNVLTLRKPGLTNRRANMHAPLFLYTRSRSPVAPFTQFVTGVFDLLQKPKTLTTETLPKEHRDDTCTARKCRCVSHGVFLNFSTCTDRRCGVSVSVSQWFKKRLMGIFIYLCKRSII